jgi:hypothetical protein
MNYSLLYFRLLFSWYTRRSPNNVYDIVAELIITVIMSHMLDIVYLEPLT